MENSTSNNSLGPPAYDPALTRNSSTSSEDWFGGHGSVNPQLLRPYDPNYTRPADPNPYVLPCIAIFGVLALTIAAAWFLRGRSTRERLDGRSEGWDWNSAGMAMMFILIPGLLAIIAALASRN